eukprot:5855366-Pyramimonas_sp.AAC.2
MSMFSKFLDYLDPSLAGGLWLPAMQRMAKALPAARSHLCRQVVANALPTCQALTRLGYRVEDECPLWGQPGD